MNIEMINITQDFITAVAIWGALNIVLLLINLIGKETIITTKVNTALTWFSAILILVICIDWING